MSGINPIVILEQEIRRHHLARYDHRLHGVLMVLRGLSCQQAGRLLGDSPRALQYWVKRFSSHGLTGLQEKDRPGRPRRLSPQKMAEVELALKRQPSEFGIQQDDWDARALATYVRQYCNIELGFRQCQRLLNQFGRCRDEAEPSTANTMQSIMTRLVMSALTIPLPFLWW